jgi:hypothetical protein
MNTKADWSKTNLLKVVGESVNVSECLEKLGVVPYGGNLRTFRNYITRYSIDISHLLGRIRFNPNAVKATQKIPTRKMLVRNSTTDSGTVKNRLLKEGRLPYKCALCGIDSWQGQKLSLHLDHINGIHTDNRLSNLRLLCPNCHSLTPTYCGRNPVKNGIQGVPIRKKENNRCIDCDKPVLCGYSERCRSCAARHSNPTKIKWPSIPALMKMLAKHGDNYCAVGRKLGVSDNAVRKHIRIHS